jgi:hypothetical protein
MENTGGAMSTVGEYMERRMQDRKMDGFGRQITQPNPKPSEMTRFIGRDSGKPPVLIDITMTAVRRPEILKRTLNSFFRHLFAPIIEQCRLIINVDPIGDAIQSYELADIVQGYFSRYIIGMPMTSSFPKAFQWTWEYAAWAKAPWVFHLEDDWELNEPVDILAMIAMMEKNSNLASMRLPFFSSDAKSMKNWNLFFPWNGEFFECPKDNIKGAGFCGHPALLRGQFVQNCAPLIDIRLNPEKQFHGGNDPLVQEVMKWKYGVWGKPNHRKMINDIGIEWKLANQFQKKGNKAFFTEWEKIK